MDENKTRNLLNKIIMKVFMAILIIFTAIYISVESGYVEFQNHNKKVLTDEKIKQFENDVVKGKYIDIDDYIEKTEYNYGNKASRTGEKISKCVEKLVANGIESTFKILNKILG